VQEALTNAVRHSGATSIRVEIRRAEDRLEVRVADDGRGMPRDAAHGRASERGLGLAGMRERVTLLGGAFRVAPAPSGGTVLHATLPA
jgi:signal transduction histidine kinase